MPARRVEFQPAKGYEITHEVSSCGSRVRSRRTGRVLKRRRKDGRVLLVRLSGAQAWVDPKQLLGAPRAAGAAGVRKRPGTGAWKKRTVMLLSVGLIAAGAAAMAAAPASSSRPGVGDRGQGRATLAALGAAALSSLRSRHPRSAAQSALSSARANLASAASAVVANVQSYHDGVASFLRSQAGALAPVATALVAPALGLLGRPLSQGPTAPVRRPMAPRTRTSAGGTRPAGRRLRVGQLEPLTMSYART